MDRVTISWETAEYLAILLGQNRWGNPKRRQAAAVDLYAQIGNRPFTTSLDCFQDAGEDKPKR